MLHIMEFPQERVGTRLMTCGMCRMSDMSTKAEDILNKKTYVRSNPLLMRSLDRVLAELRADPRFEFLGKEITKEALVNASWIFIERAGVQWIAENLRPLLREIEEMEPAKHEEAAGEPSPAKKPRIKRAEKEASPDKPSITPGPSSTWIESVPGRGRESKKQAARKTGGRPKR
jgi:hypothetical protein